MLKRALVLILLVGGLALCSASEAQAWRRHRGYVVHRPVVVAPVRRVAYRRMLLPPHPVVVRRAVTSPYVPVYPVYPAYPIIYGPSVSVHLGY